MRVVFTVFLCFVALFCHFAHAANCSDVFPGAAQSASGGGSISFGSNARLINQPGNTIITRNITDNSGGVSCNTGPCAITSGTSPTGDFTTYLGGQPSVSVGFQQTQTISPGTYETITVAAQGVLRLQPGTYVIRGQFTLESQSQLVVDSFGSVGVFVRGDITIRSSASVNQSGAGYYLFLFTRDDVLISDSALVNAVMYARDDIRMGSNVQVRGAIAARDVILLDSNTSVSYDGSAVANGEYLSFCTAAAQPTLIAEWRFDEASWTGSGNEVVDSSGNGLHGFAVNYTALPNTAQASPAIPGNPGTCQYGDFKGDLDGYVQINDPGSNSILDLDTDFTVTTWIYPRLLPGSDLVTIVSKDENFEFHLNRQGRIYWWWGGAGRDLLSSSSVTLNTWQHIAITYRSGEQIIYLDGVNVGQNNSTQAITVNNDPVLISTDLGAQVRRFDGFIDEVRIYSGALSPFQIATVMTETRPCVFLPELDHFNIDVGAGTASACAPRAIAISARDSAGNVLSSYIGTIAISVSSSNGDWSDSGSALGNLTPGASDSGTASYSFASDASDGGIVNLLLSNPHAETVTITVADSAAAVSSTSLNLSFAKNAFVVTTNDLLVDDLIAGRAHGFTVAYWALNPDDTTTGCSVVTAYQGNKNVKSWLTRDSNDPGGAAPAVNNGAVSVVLPSALPAANNISLNFVNGEAAFSLESSDVGRYALNFRDDSFSFSDLVVDGGSGTYTARPFAFDIEVSGNPEATDANGAIFTAAGSAFTLSVSARGWNASDDVDLNGRADVLQDDASNVINNNELNGLVLPSFGQEFSPATVTLLVQLIAPSGGTQGLLSFSGGAPAAVVLSSFSGGLATASLTYSEVGIAQIEAIITGGDYLSAGIARTALSNSKSSAVGRFTPAYFSVVDADSVINAACDIIQAFSYFEQNFSLSTTVQAKNASGAITTNYAGDFQKLDASQGALFVGSADQALPATALSSRISIDAYDLTWSNGEGQLTATVAMQRLANTALDGPYRQVALGIDFNDADNILMLGADKDLDTDIDGLVDKQKIAETELRYGRLRLDSAFGPETAALPVNFMTEYWSGVDWIINADDSCSAINKTDILYDGNAINDPVNQNIVINAGATSGIYAADDGTTINFSLGDAGHYFSAPGAGNTGTFEVQVNLSNYPWLQFDWNQDDDASNDGLLPIAQYSFGTYRGHDRVIYWREILGN